VSISTAIHTHLHSIKASSDGIACCVSISLYNGWDL
jgi:hypothetical protein